MSTPVMPRRSPTEKPLISRHRPRPFADLAPLRARPEIDRFRALHEKTRRLALPQRLVDRFRPTSTSTSRRLTKALPFSGPDQRLVQRLTFGWNLAEQERVASMGLEAWLEEQLQPETLDDGGLEDALREALPSLSMSSVEILINYEDFEEPIYELWLATLFRAAYSPRQLYERMVHFWSDHFSINIFDDFQFTLQPVDHRQVARAHALGRFGDLLRASAHSPAMLVYLTNASNIAGHPNENYARELMELHTLGVDGGYTEEDVREVARCLTGWTISTAEDLTWGTYQFNPNTHDAGTKRVLGVDLPAGSGPEDGDRMLEILETHPSTARFITDKLLRRVLGVEVHPRLRDEIAQVFVSTGGDIRTVLRESVRAIWPSARPNAKLKRPFHLATSALRSTFAGLEDPFFLIAFLFEAGHLPFSWAPPNGYPDGGPYWAGLPLPRWNFAQYLVGGLGELDLSYLDPADPPDVIADTFSFVLFGALPTPERRARLIDFIAALPADPARLREALALVASSPEAQYH